MSSPALSPRRIGLVLGPSIALLMVLLGPPASVSETLRHLSAEGALKINASDTAALAAASVTAWATGALLVWMAVWWATEPIPIPVTSLLPLVVLPLVGAGMPAQIGAGYAHHVVLLLLGGFIIALGIERWGLHRRIALTIISWVGTSPKSLIAGFMIATALLSMWISNTATTLMMVPIALSAAATLRDESGHFVTALLLGICYAASIGGVATPIGTPTNLIAIEWLRLETGASIGFPQWMTYGVPAAALLIPAAWFVVTRGIAAGSAGHAAAEEVRTQRSELGRMSRQEIRIALVFGVVALLWITRLPLSAFLADLGWPVLRSLKGQADTVIAIAGAIAVFLVPAGNGERRGLLSWEEAVKIPWGVLLLFGGGIALGNAVKDTGLSAWIGDQLGILSVLPPLFFVAVVVALVIFLTELTSNVATMTTLAPILGALGAATGTAPASLLAPAAVAASCAFMLPVATAPNAIVYASGEVTIGQMMKFGFRINLIGIVVITLIGYWLAPLVL